MTDTVEQRMLLVANSGDDFVPDLLRQLGISSRYSKLRVDTCDLDGCTDLPCLDQYASVLLVSQPDAALLRRSHSALTDFVESGGGLTLLLPPALAPLQTLAGFRSVTQPAAPGDDQPRTLRFTSERFPGLRDVSISLHDVEDTCLYTLAASGDIHVDACFDDGAPAIWRRRQGRGEVGTWAFLPMGRHWGRALLLHFVVQTQRIGVKGIANAAMFQVDDYPAPPTEAEVPLGGQATAPWPHFLARHWLPELRRLAERFGVVYSFALVYSYNQRTHPPFDFDDDEPVLPAAPDEWDAGNPFATLEAMGEVGFHGYNHVPLRTRYWDSAANMGAALRASMHRWQETGHSRLPVSYVPPMNEYDETGIQALAEACPGIVALCGNFWGSRENGGGREFEPEPWHPDWFCLPRVTSGHALDDVTRWGMLSSLYELGAWTHFIHPDDILDVPRQHAASAYCRNPGARPWAGPDGLAGQLSQLLLLARESHPWLQFVTAEEAASRISSHLDNSLRFLFEGDDVVIDSTRTSHVVVFARGNDVGIRALPRSARLLDASMRQGQSVFTLLVQPGRTRLALSR